VTGLGRFAYETWRRERGSQGPARWHGLPPEAQRAWNVTAEAITAVERERAAAEIDGIHYVIFGVDGWTIEHPVECQMSRGAAKCRCRSAIAAIADEDDPDMFGRWRITSIDSEGLPSLERAEREVPS
jgi:hypothetical protein